MSKRQAATTIAPSRDDQRYFTIVPHLVWVVSRNAYDLMFWHVVKMIAGNDGECTLGVNDLAQACSMSVGKVVDCRNYLIEQGLLAGEFAKEDGPNPQTVWHLRIPDLWPRNVEWRSHVGNGLRDRIQARADFHRNLSQRVSPDEGRVSPGETRVSPGEGRVSPHETLQRELHYRENQQEEPVRRTSKKNDDDARARDDGSSSSFLTWDQLVDHYGQTEVTEAVRLAKDRGTDFRYVAGILKNRARRGAAPQRNGTGRRDPYDW